MTKKNESQKQLGEKRLKTRIQRGSNEEKKLPKKKGKKKECKSEGTRKKKLPKKKGKETKNLQGKERGRGS